MGIRTHVEGVTEKLQDEPLTSSLLFLTNHLLFPNPIQTRGPHTTQRGQELLGKKGLWRPDGKALWKTKLLIIVLKYGGSCAGVDRK